MEGWPLERGAISGRVQLMVKDPSGFIRLSVTYESCSFRHKGTTCPTVARSSSTTPFGPRMAIETDAGNMLPQDSDEIPQAPQPTIEVGELGIGGQFAVKVMFFESVVHDRHVLGS